MSKELIESSKRNESSIRSLAEKPQIIGDPDFHRGSSTFTYPNGDRYEGEYCAHVRGLVWKEGFGTYFTKDGQSYKGKWYNDKLIDDEQVVITFKDGTVFEGKLEKYHYKGAGCLRLPGNITLILEFLDNKPVGDIILLDGVGRPWYSRSEGDSTVFHQENIYFENIPANRGVGKSRFKIISKPITKSTEIEKKPIDLDAIKERAFKKNEKITEDYRFEESEWYQNYINFKQKQQVIMSKVKRGLKSQLNDEEYAWVLKYEEFKEKYNQLLQNRKVKVNDPIDMSLLHTFCSEEYRASKPDFVMYPSKKEDN